MKRALSVILTICMVFTLLPAMALQSWAVSIQTQEIDLPVQTNPLYDDVVDPEHLPGYEKPLELPTHGQTGNPYFEAPVYMTDYLTAVEAVDVVREGLKNRDAEISVAFTHVDDYDINEILNLLLMVAMDHTGISTEGDYLMWTWATWYPEGEYYQDETRGLYYITLTYHMTYYTTNAQEQEMDAAVDVLLNDLDLYEATDYAKVRGIYDYLCENVTYDYANLEDDDYLLKYTAYAALMHGTAVCQGYAVLFYRLALELGVDSRVIVGWQTSSGGSHAWNIAQLGDMYYNLDATWDAGYDYYDFFLTNDENFYDHTRDPDYSTSEFNGYYPMGDENYLDNMQGVLESGVQWRFDPMTGTMFVAGSGPMGDYAYTSDSAIWKRFVDQIWYAEIEEGITEIGTYAFMECWQLRSVKLPRSLEAINDGAFWFSGLPELELPDNLKYIGCSAFANSGLTGITIPDSVEVIDVFAFEGCEKLQSITFPKNMTELASHVCWNCPALSKVILPEKLVKIGINAFESCYALQTVDLPDSLEIIDVGAFGNCHGMTELWIPASVHTIGSYGLSGMFNMKTLYFMGDAPSMDSSALDGTTGTAYYPGNNATWTKAYRDSLNSVVTWEPYDPPVYIVMQPQDVVAEEGTRAEVVIDAKGDGLTYQWYFKNPGTNKFYLTTSFQSNVYYITMSEARNGRQVYCVVTDQYGNKVTSDVVTLRMGRFAAIKTQPQNVTAAEGEKAIVTVEATGDGLTYQWYYRNAGGEKFALAKGYTSNTFEQTMTSARSGRQVYCVITDQYGNSVTTQTVTIKLPEIAKIVTQPTDVVVQEGEKAIVTVEAVGDGLTYQWYYKNASGKKFALTTSFAGNSYYITMTEVRDGRQVYCVITDQYGNSVTTETATLKMGVFAKINTQPEDVTVAEGKRAVITLDVVGDGLTYQWYFKNPETDRFYLTTSFTGNSYYITMTGARDGRQVYCVITDQYGNQVRTDTVTLRMEHYATIVTQPTDVAVVMGEQAIATVEAEGDGLTYQWYYKNAGGSKFSLAKGFTSRTFEQTMTSGRNGRQIYCAITDRYGNTVTTDTVTLKVAQYVELVSQPVDVTVAANKRAAITLDVVGDGLTYQWYFKNRGASEFSLTTSFQGNSYYVTMTEARDGRQVYCVITDQYGNTVITDTVTLRMEHYARIVTQPEDVMVAVGEQAIVTVEAEGDGLTYQWYYKNAGGSKFSLAKGFTSSTFQQAMSSGRNGRQIYCVITDKYGNTVTTDTVTLYMK